MDLEIKFCSCGKFQESGFPCAHAAAYLISAGKNPHNYCHESAYGAYVKRMYHQDKNFRSTVLTDLLRVQPTPLALPKAVILRGRPKASRRIESQSVVSSIRKKRVVVCPRCGIQGHIAKSCPQRNFSQIE